MKKQYFPLKNKRLDKMKKNTFLTLTIITLGLVSCKKERTCTCESTIVSSTGVTGGVGYVDSGPFATETDKMVMPKITKKTGKANCVSNEHTQTHTETNGDTKTQVIKRDCVLK